MALSSSFLLSMCSFIFIFDVNGQSGCQYTQLDDFHSAQIILFFAPRFTDVIREQIAIYYSNPGFKPGDVIGLHVNNTLRSQRATNYYYPQNSSGIIYTGINAELLSYSDPLIFDQQCLGYDGSWFRNETIMKTSCLSTHPDWMHQLRKVLRNRRLSSIMIPGTHNSGSYIKEDSQSMFHQFTATQDRDILQQLVSGVRYFDLRPGFNDEYWIVHGHFHMNRFDQIIRDFKEFMDNTDEVIIVNMREFPVGFSTAEDHRKFIQYLEVQLKDYIIPRASKLWEITFREIWKSRERLIISYDNQIYRKTRTLWPPIPHMWGNVQIKEGLDGLKDYLKHCEARRNVPRASMAEFTMDIETVTAHAISDVIGIEHTSLRRLGYIVGPHVTQWYNELFYQNASIIAVDYLDATGIVEVAVEWNKRRFSICYDSIINQMKQYNPEGTLEIIDVA